MQILLFQVINIAVHSQLLNVWPCNTTKCSWNKSLFGGIKYNYFFDVPRYHSWN